jgi:hypothetical protein
VHSFLMPMLKGLIAIFAISGLGRFALRLARIRNLSWYWSIAVTALAGQTVANILVQAVLLVGAGSAAHLRLIAWLLVGIATAGHLLSSWPGDGKKFKELFQANKIVTAILLLALLTNLVVALAPSTKIDELYYHMLTPKRIVEDGGMQFYLLPVESAIVPHMQYQITLSVAHAAGVPDAGNVLSWGYSVVLFLFLIGFLMDATGDRHLALLCGSLCSAGVYATIWHTAGGPHALGDLAMVVALAGVLRPALLMDAVGPKRYAFFLVTAAALAASTKLSLLPLSLVASALIAFQAIRRQPPGRKVINLIGLALLPWIVLHLPLMIWTYRVSGSFWGPVLASVFGRSAYPEWILQYAGDLQAFNPELFSRMARNAVIEFSPVFFVSILWVLWTAFRGRKTSQLIACLFILQGGLVAWKFHFDFRFLGGLEYVLVLAAFLTLTNPEGVSRSSDEWAQLGKRLARSRKWILLFAGVPWLGSQIYYARPFAGVVSGLVPRNQFMERSVELTRDFEMLDRVLPKDAVLYLVGGRWPNFYAPRPVVLTPLDLRGRTSIFRLAGPDELDDEQINAKTLLKCGQTVYSNDQAVIVTSLIPGRVPFIGPIKVQSCQLQSAGAGPLP